MWKDGKTYIIQELIQRKVMWLCWYKINFRVNKMSRYRKRVYRIIIKGSIYQNDMEILNVYYQTKLVMKNEQNWKEKERCTVVLLENSFFSQQLIEQLHRKSASI